ncbi:hypothetical protein HYX06_04015 [Candidatus Woesearchaeota archaeon]|nr:hypothetical protein [Candidatus Woesearchaeota archaeon]
MISSTFPAILFMMVSNFSIGIPKFIANLVIFKKLNLAERVIGYRLTFRQIPDLWINGLMVCDMTNTWNTFGLKICKGANYFTVGKVKDGVSSRFNFGEPQYQSWLGGYTVKLKEAGTWSLQDHLNLAVADQKSWLKRYGDPHPLCDMREEDFCIIGSLKLRGYSGTLYGGDCITHSDVGDSYDSTWLWLSAVAMAVVFNMSNPSLSLRGSMLRPRTKGKSYETLRLKGYIAIFDIDNDVKVVLYGNGVADTFEMIKNELYRAMELCEITRA